MIMTEVRDVILTLVLLGWFQTVTLRVTGDAPGLPDRLQLLVKLILVTHMMGTEKYIITLTTWFDTLLYNVIKLINFLA